MKPLKMKPLKALAVVVTLAGLAVLGLALAPSVYSRFDAGVSAQGRQDRGRELTLLGGRGGELGVRVTDAASGGVQIEEVEPDSPADNAGLKRGDVIVTFDGEHVRGARQFARLIQETPAGRRVKTTIVRNGQTQDVEVTPTGEADRFGRLRDLPFNFNLGFDWPGTTSNRRLGVSVNELTHQLAEYFGAKEGVLVTSVSDGSAASHAGIKAGDVITSINGEKVASREDLLRALRQSDDEEITIGIVRDKKETSVKAKIEPRRPLRSARPV